MARKDDVALYHVRGTNEVNTRAIQVNPVCAFPSLWLSYFSLLECYVVKFDERFCVEGAQQGFCMVWTIKQ